MSDPKQVALKMLLESDSSDDESVEELKYQISKLKEDNEFLSQERTREKWSYQEKIDKFQKEIEGECVSWSPQLW